MKKWQGLTLGCLLAFNNFAYAQIADVTGVGEDSESALRDAKRNAVEHIVGTYINSETLVSQAAVVSDEIYAKSVGFVTDVQVLDEGRRNGSYYVHAKINVNTNPNSELMNRIEMIRALGDPRIGVIVTYYGDVDNEAKEKYPLMCEAAINNKLAELGFSHVISSNIVLQEKQLDRNLAASVADLLPNNTIDYLIIGKLDLHTDNINLPKYTDLANGDHIDNFSTNLINTVAEINVDVIKAVNGEVINSFRTETKAINNSNNNAENAAIKQLSNLTASKIKTLLSRKAANVDNQMELVIESGSHDKITQVITALQNLAGVTNVQEKNYSNGRAVVTIDTTFKPQTIFRMLKENCKAELFMKNVSANNIGITVR